MQKVKIAIVGMATIYGRTLNDSALTMYANMLKGYREEDVLRVIEQIMADPKIRTLPVPGDILSRLNPTTTDTDDGMLLAHRIQALVERRGRSWTDGTYQNGEPWYEGQRNQYHKTWREAVDDALGSLGYEVIRQAGGWLTVCENFNNSDHHNVRVGLRFLAEACIRASKAGTLNQPISLPENQTNQQLNSTIKQLAEKKSMEDA